uniref:TP901 family phage tail tape measure protein n=1 Tax=uncultured marine virus TaxID=186617 RepID=A0A0F7L6E4_9VIRU|nr:TP901 family phage tail tape measure protein [uncultured marine virus]
MADQNLKVNITGDSSKLNAALASASSKLKGFGSKMQSVGKSMSTSLTLPIVAAGAAATKMAFDFDKSMTSIQALVGVSAEEVGKMGEAAKKMALDAGKGANEAAEAMFFITSAGLRGAKAMDVLDMSLKAAAIGLGETKTIADLSTSALNAYGEENLSASGATDILTAAVREGKLEASQLAGAMGGVIPIASNMGIGFDEVGAAMAAMSKTGTSASEGATQLNAILASLKKPTDGAKKALETMGMTTESVQKSLSEEGLLSTLEMLQQGLKQTGQDTTAIFPNIRALKGVLDLTGAGLEENRKVFDALSNSMGATDKAFQATSQSASFKMTKGLNSMKSSLLEVGQVILVSVAPVVEKLGNFFTSLSEKFKALSPTTKKIIVAFIGIVAALGPVIAIIGTLMTMAPAIGAAFTVMTGPIGLVVAALAAVAYVIAKNWKPIKKAIIDVANYFIDLYNESALVQIGINALIMVFKNAFAYAKFMVKNIITIFKAFGKAVMGIFGSIGDIIMGVLTLDIAKIKKGFSGVGAAMSDGFNEAVDGIKANATELGETVVDNFNDALEKKTIKKLTLEADVVGSKEGTATAEGTSKGTPKGKKFTVTPVVDPDAAAKLAAISNEINKALITNDKLAYNARKTEATKYYDDLIKTQEKGSEKEKALQKAKGAALAQIEMDENNRLLDIKNRIADSSNTTDEERKALEIANIKSHYATLIALAEQNGLDTTALLAAQADAIALVNDEKRAQALQNAADFAAGVKGIVEGGLQDLASGIGESLGQALASGGNLAQSLSKVVLTTIGTMAMQMGKLAISIGVGVEGIKQSLKSLNPGVAIAAGIALVALGSFAKAKAGEIGSGGGATAFANGGIVSGPTMGLVGEYPGARQNPEVIAPLNKLQNMIGGAGGSQHVSVGGEIRIEGQDLLIAIQRANETADRLF